MTERPLVSANAVEWRKYAEELERELEQYRPQDTGITIYGIPLYTDPSVPDGEAQLRYQGVTVHTILGLQDFMDRISDPPYAEDVMPKFSKAIQRIGQVLMRQPDQICVPPKIEYEPCAPGVFPRIKGETGSQYQARYSLFQERTRRFNNWGGDDLW